MIDAAASCVAGSRFNVTQNIVAFAGVGLIVLVLWVAASYPRNEKRHMRVLGGGFLALGGVLSVAALIASSLSGHPDQCGSRHGAAATAIPWLVIGAAAAIMLGGGVLTVTEWAPVAVLTVVDVAYCVLALLGPYPHRGEVAGPVRNARALLSSGSLVVLALPRR